MKILILTLTLIALPGLNLLSSECTSVVDMSRHAAESVDKTSDGKTCYNAAGEVVSAVNGVCPDGASAR